MEYKIDRKEHLITANGTTEEIMGLVMALDIVAAEGVHLSHLEKEAKTQGWVTQNPRQLTFSDHEKVGYWNNSLIYSMRGDYQEREQMFPLALDRFKAVLDLVEEYQKEQ